MKPEISEFSYGYAVTEALIFDKCFPLKAAPIFPSLIEEGKVGGGYDLKLDSPGLPLFLQFKLSDYMKKRKNTREIKEGLFSSAFRRMHLHSSKKSSQHKLLINLESNNKKHVYYIAPLFYQLKDFNKTYLSRKILEESIFFRPSNIGSLPDDDEHWVAFQVAKKPAFLCSDPQEIQPPLKITDIERSLGLGLSLLEMGNISLRVSIESLLTEMLELLRAQGIEVEIDIPTNDLLMQASFLSRMLFNCQLYIVQKK
jgi:hypothetical protein